MRSGAQIPEEILRRVAAIEADPVQMERLAAGQAGVDALHAAIGRQATRRAHQLAESPAERAWPPIRVREAWVLARYGADQIGPGSATAVRLNRDRHAQLLRAVKRYERYIASMQKRAQARHEPPKPHQFYRLPGRQWPAWLRLAPDGQPILVDDVDGPNRLALAIDHTHPQLPPAGDAHRRLIERDAWLTHGHWPPIELDGRTHTHHRHHGLAEPATRPQPVDHELLELAHL